MIPRSLRHRAPVLWLLIPFVLGLISARAEMIFLSTPLLLASASFALLGAFFLRNFGNFWIVPFFAALIAGGAAFYELHQQRLPLWEELPPREARLSLRIERVFLPHADARKISGLATVVESSGSLTELRGQHIYFSVAWRRSDPMPIRSEVIAVTGLLSSIPRQAEIATFDGFLLNSGINFRIVRGRIRESLQQATPYNRFCHRTQRSLSSLLGRGLDNHSHLSSIYRAMVLGEVTELTEEQNRLFRESGTMHLFSISGLHIAAIAVALHMLLSLCRLPRWSSWSAGLALLWLYVDVTGCSSSAVRAFVMVALFETAFVLRRAVNPVATLAFAAFVSLLVNPMQVFSAGFQMSYGIVAALLLLGLPLVEFGQEKWRLFRDLPEVTWRWWHHAAAWGQRGLISALGIGVATSLVSTIAGVLYFQLFTPGALFANLVLIPASSLALWSGFLSLLFGLLGLTSLAVVFNHSAALTLLGMEKGIQLFLTVPGVFATVGFKSTTMGFIAFAGLLALLLAGYSDQWQRRSGSWWPPFAWTALWLIFGARWN